MSASYMVGRAYIARYIPADTKFSASDVGVDDDDDDGNDGDVVDDDGYDDDVVGDLLRYDVS